MGVYIGNGEVIEARGVEYGVVKTRLGDHLTDQLERLVSILGLAHHFDREGVGVGKLREVVGSAPSRRREQGLQAAPGSRLVVDDEYSCAHDSLILKCLSCRQAA